MLYTSADARKQERHLKRIRLAVKRGWHIHSKKPGYYGLRDPDGNEMGYQLFSTTECAWAGSWLDHFVLLWDERIKSAWNHTRLAVKVLCKNG